jgi:hypothetical protein
MLETLLGYSFPLSYLNASYSNLSLGKRIQKQRIPSNLAPFR